MQILLFLLLALLTAVRCQETPTVSIAQNFTEVYLGDTLVLKCSGSGEVKWYHNDRLETHSQAQCIVPVLSVKDKVSYSCEQNGKRSANFMPKVTNYNPPGVLSIKSGNSVVFQGESVILNLEVVDGLNGWRCFVYKGGKLFGVSLNKLLTAEAKNIDFQSSSINIDTSPVIYWCNQKGRDVRSNTVTVTATDKRAILVSNPDLPVYGTEVALKCMVPGAMAVTQVVFYKNKEKMSDHQPPWNYAIKEMTKNDDAEYTCSASYKYVENSEMRSDSSNVWKLGAREPSPKATISVNGSTMVCYCSQCPEKPKYRYYKHLESGQKQMFDALPTTEPGRYSCRAMWDSGVSMLSDPVEVFDKKQDLKIIIVISLVLLAILILAVFVFLYWRKKRRTEALYQEVPLGAVKSSKGDEGYEDLQKTRSGTRSGDYDTLKGERKMGGEAEGPKQEGGYQALKTTPGAEKDMVYHTIKLEGSDDASKDDATKGEELERKEAGYEALRVAKGEETEYLYDTIGQ